MSERSAPVDRAADREEQGARAGPDDAAAPRTELTSVLSALGNQRVQRLLSEPPPGGVALQRQEEGESDGDADEATVRAEQRNQVLNAVLSAQALMNGAMQNVQSGAAENLPGAMEMVTSASGAVEEGYAAAQALDPELHSRMLGFRQSIIADLGMLQPHVGDPVSLESIGTHMGNVTMLFAEQAIASAQGTS